MISYSAPGRVNLIGEHTDYNLGYAMPIALPQRTVVTFSPDDSAAVTACSEIEDDPVRIALGTKPGEVPGWAGYVAGVIWALRQAGYKVPGGEMTITSDVPVGAGLSSSAALECAVLGALDQAGNLQIGRTEQARIAQRAENEYVGAPTGLLDQLASLYGEPGKAVLIDFLDTSVRPVDFDPDASGVVLLLINSQSRHRNTGGDYAARRSSCERAAAELGVTSLREVHDVAALAGVSDPTDVRRARHVLTENQRVLDFARAVEADDYGEAGRLFNASQQSMRDDFQITTEHIDLIADTAIRAGALGARMTGGGFGGCVIALVPEDRLGAVVVGVRDAMRNGGFIEPVITRSGAAAGAGSN